MGLRGDVIPAALVVLRPLWRKQEESVLASWCHQPTR